MTLENKLFRVFYSIDTNNKSNDKLFSDIFNNSKIIKDYFKRIFSDTNIEVLCNIKKTDYNDLSENRELFLLGRGISEIMSKCDYFVFDKIYYGSPNRMVELYTAKIYDIPYIEYDNIVKDTNVYNMLNGK